VVVDLVLLEQELDPAGEAVDGFGLGLLHLGHVDRDAVDLDPVRREAVQDVVVVVRAGQQGLAGDAPHVEARPPQPPPHLDARRSQPELRRLDGGHVPAGTAP
jgi:hypothetical protein